ncbi:hypothetical protein [Pseudonocardia sp. ICBG601]|uniref:hypothetical protein n=1 Tax=Pseudonocardia sp. ICBG601 TaxID=2846759 RepID=UPI001CF6F389|nr:hypothetical protein [Pseudonocardia sp. ICBG601]
MRLEGYDVIAYGAALPGRARRPGLGPDGGSGRAVRQPGPIGMLVGTVLVGLLTDLLGRRRPVLAGVALLSPAMVRYGPAPGVALLAGLAGRRSALPEGQGDDPAEHGVAP